MDDVTDTVFRQTVASTAAPDIFFTEFVNVDGLQSPGRPKLFKKMRFTSSETPLILQLWGTNPENYYKTVQQVVDGTFAREMGLEEGLQYAGIDINMGCPVKGVVKHGCCSALIDDRPKALEMIKATQEAANGRLPVSVKTRLGTRKVDFTWHELLLQQKLNMLTIHGRTAKQMSLVPAEWENINRVREIRDALKLNTLIVGNGDVETQKQGLELAEKYKLDGIMIGRGVFHDPFVFAKDSPWEAYTKEQKVELYRSQVTLFRDTWNNRERAIHTLNKFCKIYINGFDGAKELREHLMVADSADELLEILREA
jgi:tRNA-dihydrouridine synthase